MQCSACQKNVATLHLTMFVKGAETLRIDLCETCAREKGILDDPPSEEALMKLAKE
jgi:protein-arginine kinase activator protein McsA